MHIQGQEGNNTTLTTCTKMTEEVDRRHGMNGNSSSKGISEEQSSPLQRVPLQQSKGGRLKFYKDGKMILELTGNREGEKVNWVSVPHKTIWVPASSGIVPPNSSTRQERAASLSVSDDNSSIQSSPWQRDHCWKQTAPRKGIGTEMSLMYVRPTCLPARLLRCPAARIKRRRPLCPAPVLPLPANGCSSPLPENIVPYRNTDKPTFGKFKFLRNKDSVAEPIVLRVYKKCKKNYKSRELCKVIEMLKERVVNYTPVNTKVSNCKQEWWNTVSPRKRILREMEKVSIEDAASKRSKARHLLPSHPQPGPSCAPDPKLHNGSSSTSRSNPQPSKPVSSYSIHSILSITDESSHPSLENAATRKAMSYSGSSKTESPVSAHSPDSHSTRASHYSKASSPLSPDVRRSHYGYSKTDSPSPSPSPEQYRRPSVALSAPRPPFHPHHALPYQEHGEYYYADDYAYRVLQSGIYLPSPYIGQYFRPPPPLMHYPALPPGPWAPLPHPLLTDHTPRDDASSDLPLNLSKH